MTGEEARPRRENRGGGRGRRIVLLAGILLVVALLVGGGFLLWRSPGGGISANAGYNDSVKVGEKPTVRLINGRGQIELEGKKDLKAVEIEARRYALGSDPSEAKGNASDVPINISREGSTLTIKTGGGEDTGADYDVRVPTGSSVEVESGAGEVSVKGVREAKITAEAGDVSVEKISGPVSVESPEGDVTVRDVRTDSGQTELSVGTGNVELENLVVGTLDAEVGAGEVSLLGRFGGSGRVLVRTGDIVVKVPPGDTGELTLETRVGRVLREGGGERG